MGEGLWEEERKKEASGCATDLRIGENPKKQEYALGSTASHWRTAVAAGRYFAISDNEAEKEVLQGGVVNSLFQPWLAEHLEF